MNFEHPYVKQYTVYRMEGMYISSRLSVHFIPVTFRSGRLSVHVYNFFGGCEFMTGHVICL